MNAHLLSHQLRLPVRKIGTLGSTAHAANLETHNRQSLHNTNNEPAQYTDTRPATAPHLLRTRLEVIAAASTIAHEMPRSAESVSGIYCD